MVFLRRDQKIDSKCKPCPFCGELPTIEPWHGGGPMKRCISCASDYCPVSPSVTGGNTVTARRYWNHRAG